MNQKLLKTPKQNKIVKIGIGSCFGELALIDDMPRAATIVSLQPTHLMTIQKDEYKELLERVDKKRQENVMEFLSGIPYLKNFPRSLGVKLIFHLTPVTYKNRGTVVFEQGKTADCIAFVLSGEFEVVKFNITSDDKTLLEFVNDQNENQKLSQTLKKKRFITTIFEKSKAITDANSHLNNKMTKQIDNITMGYLGPGNVFGDADIISKRPYMFTLRVKQENSSLYLLKADVFLKYFGQFKDNFRTIERSCLESDLRHLKRLSDVIMGKWSSSKFEPSGFEEITNQL